ncbi:MAG TPA: glycerate kinase [Nitrososphaerales archaeon]|nr:glycerate kinase [Nitrososphaerales archaeon]
MAQNKLRKPINSKRSSSSVRTNVLRALNSAILAADPKTSIARAVEMKHGSSVMKLKPASLTLDLSKFERVFVIGGGKACASMAEEIEDLIRERITGGVVNVPDYLRQRPELKKIELHDASHPIPSEVGARGVREMLQLVRNLTPNDLVICLISGGGSALLPLPAEGVTLRDKQKTTSLLLKSGAAIHEINTVRKHLSGVKGGRLAEKLQPATVVSLIISDVVGDDISSIASGPTAPDDTTYKDAMDILNRYGIWRRVPQSVRKVIDDGVRGRREETPKSNSMVFSKVHNLLIGSNKQSCIAAERSLKNVGYRTLVLSTKIQGEATQVGGILASIAKDIRENGLPLAPPAAIVAGGETTVTVRGKGIGGRNQEVALSASLGISGLDRVVIASIGTDGVDGPTDAAGAIVDGNTVKRGKEKKMEVTKYLKNNDSHSFFQKLGDLIITGPTGTNVNDVMVIAVGGRNHH